VLGDIDNDGDVDAFLGNIGQDSQIWFNESPGAVVDYYYAAARSATDPATFDMNGDQSVNQADVDHVVRRVLATEYGDANVDGQVDFDDFVVLAAAYGDSGGWARGDFSGDGIMDFADFVLLADYFGFSRATL
jgi:hypothetical protein